LSDSPTSSSQHLLASHRFEEYFIVVFSTGTLALHNVENEAGEAISRLVRFELRR